MFTKKTKKVNEELKKVKKAKKVEVKPEIKDHTKDLKEALDLAYKLKGVRGFILLVDAQTKDEEGKDKATGLNCVSGDGKVLSNLIANIDPKLMDLYKTRMELKKLTEGLNGMDDILKAVLKFAKDN